MPWLLRDACQPVAKNPEILQCLDFIEQISNRLFFFFINIPKKLEFQLFN